MAEMPPSQFTRYLKGNLVNSEDSEVIQKMMNQLAIEVNPSLAIQELQSLSEESKATTELKLAQLDEKINQQVTLVASLTKALIFAENLTEDQRAQIVAQFPEWRASVLYRVGQVCTYNTWLFEVVKEHVSDPEKTPDKHKELYNLYINPVVVDESGQEAEVVEDYRTTTYHRGNKVRYKGEVYESLIDNNGDLPTNKASWSIVN